MTARDVFRARFPGSGPVVLPVIHVLDLPQIERNIERVVAAGAPGCFLINHNFGSEQFLPLVQAARGNWRDLWLGVNCLDLSAREAFERLADFQRSGCSIDAYWADNGGIDPGGVTHPVAKSFSKRRATSGWEGLYFGGTAFKYQREVTSDQYARVALAASQFMDVVTTSGPATGEPVDPAKLAAFRGALPNHPIAIASGVRLENAAALREADCFLVATSINQTGNFFEIDAARLQDLVQFVGEL